MSPARGSQGSLERSGTWHLLTQGAGPNWVLSARPPHRGKPYSVREGGQYRLFIGRSRTAHVWRSQRPGSPRVHPRFRAAYVSFCVAVLFQRFVAVRSPSFVSRLHGRFHVHERDCHYGRLALVASAGVFYTGETRCPLSAVTPRATVIRSGRRDSAETVFRLSVLHRSLTHLPCYSSRP